MKKNRILIVEDEQKLSRIMEDFLRIQGYEVERAQDGETALGIFYDEKKKLDLILLDLMLPGISGYEVLREIRETSGIPVILLTARSSVEDQMDGFEYGADDYIVKPYTLELVKLHIEAVLKRAGKLKSTIACGDITVDLGAHRVYLRDAYVETTHKEYDLLVHFIENEGTVLRRNTILDAVWGYSYAGDIRTVDTLVKQLRRKLGDAGSYIKSVYGVGYMLMREAP